MKLIGTYINILKPYMKPIKRYIYIYIYETYKNQYENYQIKHTHTYIYIYVYIYITRKNLYKPITTYTHTKTHINL